MPSPFPGMNPYLEQEDVWQDFHDRFIPALGDALSPQVSPQYIVKIEEHLYIHEPPGYQRIKVGHGDITVAKNPNFHAAPNGGTALLAPAPSRVVVPQIDFEKQTYLEIRDRVRRTLVTVIELLSPTNKRPGSDRDQYLVKRGNLMRSQAHFVELDLLRGGPRMPLEKAPPCDYYALVSRVEERPEAGFWPIGLRDGLPTIAIPLREPHPDARLNLQEVLHIVHDRAYYKDYIYQGAPNPPLNDNDAAWAAGLLQ